MPNVVVPGSAEAKPVVKPDEKPADEVDTSADDEEEIDTDDETDVTPVTFASKAEYVKHVNNIVKKRLVRNEQKYAPIVAEHDTLKKRVAELEPLQQGQSQSDQIISAMKKQLDDLVNYKSATERNELVRSIAKEKGLPDEFLTRVQGDDSDSITEDVEQLVELLKVDGKPAKTTPKTTKPASKDEGKGGKGSGGKGGAEDDDHNDPKEIAKSVGRYGHRPIFMG